MAMLNGFGMSQFPTDHQRLMQQIAIADINDNGQLDFSTVQSRDLQDNGYLDNSYNPALGFTPMAAEAKAQDEQANLNLWEYSFIADGLAVQYTQLPVEIYENTLKDLPGKWQRIQKLKEEISDKDQVGRFIKTYAAHPLIQQFTQLNQIRELANRAQRSLVNREDELDRLSLKTPLHKSIFQAEKSQLRQFIDQFMQPIASLALAGVNQLMQAIDPNWK